MKQYSDETKEKALFQAEDKVRYWRAQQKHASCKRSAEIKGQLARYTNLLTDLKSTL